jgi:hypothetical protein
MIISVDGSYGESEEDSFTQKIFHCPDVIDKSYKAVGLE